MKYLAFMEWNWEDAERISVLRDQVYEEQEKGSDKFPKTRLFDGHTLQAELFKKSRDGQSFWIFETDNEQHLINYQVHYAPYLDIKFIPITSTRTGFQDWLKTKR
jgi:hypothetical protein